MMFRREIVLVCTVELFLKYVELILASVIFIRTSGTLILGASCEGTVSDELSISLIGNQSFTNISGIVFDLHPSHF
jgi:hypothetical protein